MRSLGDGIVPEAAAAAILGIVIMLVGAAGLAWGDEPNAAPVAFLGGLLLWIDVDLLTKRRGR